MAEKSGVEIYKRFYPWPERFRLGDPVLVQQVTGMTWPEFTRALAEQEQAIEEARWADDGPADVDQVILAGLIAVAFWQGNPQMSREKARRAVERIALEDVELIEGDEEGDDVRPPAEATAGEPPRTSSSESVDSLAEAARTEIPQDSISAETNQNASGSPGSHSALPESLPA